MGLGSVSPPTEMSINWVSEWGGANKGGVFNP